MKDFFGNCEVIKWEKKHPLNWKQDRLLPGNEIQIAKMYQHLYDLERSKNTLCNAAKSLRGLADLLEVHDPVVRSACVASDADGGL